LDFNEARDDGWKWHQLEHMQIIYTLLHTDNHSSTSPLSFHRYQSTEGTNHALIIIAAITK